MFSVAVQGLVEQACVFKLPGDVIQSITKYKVFIYIDKYTWKLHIKNHPESFQILAKCQESL